MTQVNKFIILFIFILIFYNTKASYWGISKEYNINYKYDTLNFYLNFIDLYREYDIKLPIGWNNNFGGPTKVIYFKDIVKNFNNIKKLKIQSSGFVHEFQINKNGNIYKSEMITKNISSNYNLDTFKSETKYNYNINNNIEYIEHIEKNKNIVFHIKYYYNKRKIEKVVLNNYYNDEKYTFFHKYDLNKMVITVEKDNNFANKKIDNNREIDFKRKYYFLDNNLIKITQFEKYFFIKKEELYSNIKQFKNKTFQYYHNEIEEINNKYFLFDNLHIYEYSENKLINAFGIEIEYFENKETLKKELLNYIELYDKDINFKRNKLFILENNNLPIKIIRYSDLEFKKTNIIYSYNLDYEFYD